MWQPRGMTKAKITASVLSPVLLCCTCQMAVPIASVTSQIVGPIGSYLIGAVGIVVGIAFTVAGIRRRWWK